MDVARTLEVPVVGGSTSILGRSRARRRRRRLAVAGTAVLLVLAVVGAAAGVRAVLGPDEQPGAWGGHENGRIPPAELCPVPGADRHVLRCDAAAAFGRLGVAYRARFGRRPCITDSYRSYDAQVRAHAEKPALAADPGTSNHGWGLALDLCGGANDFGTRQHRWLQANAPAHGWVQPTWAREGGAKPEPWHWEFGDLG